MVFDPHPDSLSETEPSRSSGPVHEDSQRPMRREEGRARSPTVAHLSLRRGVITQKPPCVPERSRGRSYAETGAEHYLVSAVSMTTSMSLSKSNLSVFLSLEQQVVAIWSAQLSSVVLAFHSAFT